MCFVNDDYDWIAQVYEESDRTAAKPVRCQECRRKIPAGEAYRAVELQQYEECHRCYEGECECPDGKCCQCPEPEFGETSSYRRCMDCDRFLQAVQAAEEDAGCHYSEARPGLETMLEDIREGGAADAKRYYQKAASMFPELAAGGYLKRIWKEMFGL